MRNVWMRTVWAERKVLEMKLPGKRRRGRPNRRYLDTVKEDMQEVGARQDYVLDRNLWRIRRGDPDGKIRKKKILY